MAVAVVPREDNAFANDKGPWPRPRLCGSPLLRDSTCDPGAAAPTSVINSRRLMGAEFGPSLYRTCRGCGPSRTTLLAPTFPLAM